ALRLATEPERVRACGRLSLREGVAERNGAVEDRVVLVLVLVETEISEPLELDRLAYVHPCEGWLYKHASQDFERVRVDVLGEVTVRAGIGPREQRIVEPDFRRPRFRRGDPVQGGLDLAAVGRVAPARGRIIGTAELEDVAGGVLLHFAASDEEGVAQTHFLAG